MWVVHTNYVRQGAVAWEPGEQLAAVAYLAKDFSDVGRGCVMRAAREALAIEPRLNPMELVPSFRWSLEG